MNKPALTPLEIHPIIKQRWSPRSFRPDAVTSESVQRICEAARWAPSGFNEQPWRFVIGHYQDASWKIMFDSLVEFNQKWAKSAGLLMAVFAKKSLSKNGMPNETYMYDTGGSVAWITMQAMAEGLMVHQMGGFDKVQLSTALDAAADYQPVTILAIGHQDTADKLEDNFAEMERAERSRLPHEEVFFHEKFGQPVKW